MPGPILRDRPSKRSFVDMVKLEQNYQNNIGFSKIKSQYFHDRDKNNKSLDLIPRQSQRSPSFFSKGQTQKQVSSKYKNDSY